MHLIYGVKRLWVRDYVIVSPIAPHERYSLWKMARLSGIKIVSEDAAHGLSRRGLLTWIRHHDGTWDDKAYPGYLNGACMDISKSHVDAMFERAFGYSTRVDPTTFEGCAVMKSEINYSGGGTLVDCPLTKEQIRPGHIYQKLVDNRIASDVVKEYRVSVICGEITDVIDQHRSIERRLTGRGSGGGRGSSTRKAEDVFSPADIARIHDFCALMRLEFGELDVLPDVSEGRLYILDANKTPTFMTETSAFRADRFLTVWRRAESFRRLLRRRRSLSPIPPSDQGNSSSAQASGTQ
jgi:hypothetical protein